MSPVAVVAIVIAVGEAKAPATVGLIAAAEEAFTPGSSVRLSEVPVPSDAEALDWEDQVGAGAAVSLAWEDRAHLVAHIRMHVARTNRWTDREFKFSTTDPPRERGRALGFAIASMWPDQAVVRLPTVSADRPPPPPPTTSPPPAAAVEQRRGFDGATSRKGVEATAAPARTAARNVAQAAELEPASKQTRDRDTNTTSDTRPALAEPKPDAVVTSPPVAAARKVRGKALPPRALGVAGVLVPGSGGAERGVGAALEGVLFLAPAFAVRAGVAGRGGPIPELGGSDILGMLELGVEWWLLTPSTADLFSFGFRGDALLMRHQVYDADDSQGRFLPGANLLAQVGIRIADTLEGVLAGGVEMSFGSTELLKDGQHVSAIPALRLVGQGGIRIRF